MASIPIKHTPTTVPTSNANFTPTLANLVIVENTVKECSHVPGNQSQQDKVFNPLEPATTM